MRGKRESDSNCFQPFISANPITSFNAVERYPTISDTAYLRPFSSVIGDVFIRDNVFIAPNVNVRADEGTPFYIGSNVNLQDGVVLHGLLNKRISVESRSFSIFIGNEATIAHGPCFIGSNVFVGFKSIVYNAVVTNGVRIASNRFVAPGAHIDTQEKADALSLVPKDSEEFAVEVQRVNQEFPASYHLLLGENRCSCGFAYN